MVDIMAVFKSLNISIDWNSNEKSRNVKICF